jgi:murein L,D-transpeptidase YafK
LAVTRQLKRSGVLVGLVVVISVAVALTVAIRSSPPLPPGTIADRVLIEKTARRLTLLQQGRVLKRYRVSLGRQPKGPKQQEGDYRTPEGRYVIDARTPRSRFHLGLHVSYPNAQDIAQAAARGVSPGGDIMIHGIRNGFGWVGPLHRLVDWTQGCVAVTNAEIEEISRVVPDGTEVEIRP